MGAANKNLLGDISVADGYYIEIWSGPVHTEKKKTKNRKFFHVEMLTPNHRPATLARLS